MALNWYVCNVCNVCMCVCVCVCVCVYHGDLCSNLWCVLSLISFKTNVVH